jgi:hypothetical protein
MTADRARAVEDKHLTEEEIQKLRRRALNDPAIQKRSREVLDEIERGDEPKSPGIGAEELPDFLREHNS